MRTSIAIFRSLIIVSLILQCSSEELIRRKRDNGKEDDPLLTADLFEGDIAGVDAQTLSSVLNSTLLWDRSIAYRIDQPIGFVARRAISKAMAQIESKTCVRFRNYTEGDLDYIVFVVSKGCYSYVGKQGGLQEVSIGDGCEQVGTILHLLMHVLGFWHEESRLDRDLYILINWDNIDPDNAKYFDKYSTPRINIQSATDPSQSPYDYESITHISPYAFAISRDVASILSKDERYKIGQRLELSQNDVNAIVRSYCGRRQSQLANDVMSAQEKNVLDQTVQQQTGREDGDGIQSGDGVGGGGGDGGGGDGGDTTPLIEPELPEGCRDTSTKCALWATQGLCYKNAQVMATKCPGSCQACQLIASCDNFNSLCNIWAWLGQCTGKSAQKYLAACPLACGVCAPEGTTGAENETAVSDFNQTTPMESDFNRTTTMSTTEVQNQTATTPGEPGVNATTTTSTTETEMSTTTITDEPSPTSSTPTTCPDKNKDCKKWAVKGRCFYKHIQQLCPESCNLTCDRTNFGVTLSTKASTARTRATKAPRVTKTPRPSPTTRTTTIGPCKDTRKNCDRFVPKGYCQRPAFRKGCQSSCSMCGLERRVHDDPIHPDDDDQSDDLQHLSNQCRDFNSDMCDRVDNADTCIRNDYVGRLCPYSCHACPADR